MHDELYSRRQNHYGTWEKADPDCTTQANVILNAHISVYLRTSEGRRDRYQDTMKVKWLSIRCDALLWGSKNLIGDKTGPNKEHLCTARQHRSKWVEALMIDETNSHRPHRNQPNPIPTPLNTNIPTRILQIKRRIVSTTTWDGDSSRRKFEESHREMLCFLDHSRRESSVTTIGDDFLKYISEIQIN